MEPNKVKLVKIEFQEGLKQFTQARIAIGRTGCSIPLKESLEFSVSHAQARDEVFSELDFETLLPQLRAFEFGSLVLKSHASDKNTYIKRPDFGRRLGDESFTKLADLPGQSFDISISLADGLSASAINNHAIPLLKVLLPKLKGLNLSIAPLTLVQYGRVAIADEIAKLLRAQLSIILIGERPGLSAADSMGVYITYQSGQNLTDESRNCISNIHLQGLKYQHAADKAVFIIQEAFMRKLTGVELKEQAGRLANPAEGTANPHVLPPDNLTITKA